MGFQLRTIFQLALVCTFGIFASAKLELASFAAGRFQFAEPMWGCIKGVRRSRAGYTSHVQWKHPHAVPLSPYIGTNVETIEIEYAPTVVSYERLLEVFWTMHDHTRIIQGPQGPGQYRSVVYCHTEEQLALAEESKRLFQERVGKPVVTEVQMNNTFVQAEPQYQKQTLRRRTEVLDTLNMTDHKILRSHTASLLNAYLAGKCHGVRTWEETEEEIMDLELTVPQLASMGLEVLHPTVFLTPRFGESELSPEAQKTMERQMRLRAERAQRKKEKEEKKVNERKIQKAKELEISSGSAFEDILEETKSFPDPKHKINRPVLKDKPQPAPISDECPVDQDFQMPKKETRSKSIPFAETEGYETHFAEPFRHDEL